MTNKNHRGVKTRLDILKTGVEAWKENIELVTPSEIARRLKMSHATVIYHFPNNTLKSSIADYAVEVEDSKMIFLLSAISHPSIDVLDKNVRLKHIAKMISD